MWPLCYGLSIRGIKIENKKSKIVEPEACDSEGRCLVACPQKAIAHLEETEY